MVPPLRAVNSAEKPRLSHPSLSWTDDLPVCDLCGYGASTNQIYRQDGVRRECHEFEDRSFHFCVEGCYLYGVFDGHDGYHAAHFAEQRMPAELLLGQLAGKKTDNEVKDVLLQAFEAVEKGFFDSIDDLLAVKANLLLEVPDGVTILDAEDQLPDLASQYRELVASTGSGCTATLALIYENKLYVANCGNSRVLLCRRDHHGNLRVQQLSVDHTIWDPDEQVRLSGLGVDIDAIVNRGEIGNMVYTRCIGDYKVKAGHKDIEYLHESSDAPVIAVPYVSCGIALDESCQFLILMTDGVYTALQDAMDLTRVNAEIASMVANEIQLQATLNGVAQAVVDRVVRIHHDTYMTTDSDERKSKCQIRDDLTILVRNFDCQLAAKSHTIFPIRKTSCPSALNFESAIPDEVATNSSSVCDDESSSTIDSNDEFQLSLTSMLTMLQVDDTGRVGSYVNFDSYFETMGRMSAEERSSLDTALKVVLSGDNCPPIREEPENSPHTDPAEE